jgi:hypothetical protein
LNYKALTRIKDVLLTYARNQVVHHMQLMADKLTKLQQIQAAEASTLGREEVIEYTNIFVYTLKANLSMMTNK